MTHTQPRQRSFAVAKSIIVHLIGSQAGSLGKALMECVMNGIDAGATRIDLTLDRKGYVVQDDGHGFQTEAQIEQYFEVFGFDHTTPEEVGRRQYGQFGLGRGQQWNWARTKWRTRTFDMHVDIRASGLDYTLYDGLPDAAGTTITGTFYEPLTTPQVLEQVRHLSELVRYSTVPVVINGRDVTTHPDTVRTWTHVTDEAWIQAKEHGPLKVYNMGMFVAELSAYRAGCSGVVVTKPGHALALNMARNDILDAEDGLWRRLKRLLKEIGQERTRSATRLSESDLRRFTADVATLNADFEQYQKLRLFTDAAGKNLPIGKLISSLQETGVLTLHSAEHASLSRRAMDNRLATVLDVRTLERWNVDSLDELVGILTRYSEHAWNFRVSDAYGHAQALKAARVEPDLTKAVPQLRGFYALSPEVKGYPRAVMVGLREIGRDVQMTAWRYRKDQDSPAPGLGRPFTERRVKAGQSDVADVWTDGEKYVVVHESRLEGVKTVRDVERLVLDVLQVVLPGGSTMVGAPDDTAAETLVRFLEAEPRVTEWTLRVVRALVGEAQRLNVKVPHRLLHLLGTAEGVEDQAERVAALN